MAYKDVKIYSTSSCPWCRKLKDYLKEKGISYTDYNVGSDADKLREMVNRSGQRSVPVAIIDDEVILGFDKSKIDKALGLADISKQDAA